MNKLIYRSISTKVEKSYTSLAKNKIVSSQAKIIYPCFVTGFVDGEGSFSISLTKNKLSRTGWTVQPIFSIGLHDKDEALLIDVKNYYGVGNINWEHGISTIQLRVTSQKDLIVIIEHFKKYPLNSQKRADFELFQQALQLMLRKEHLTEDGLCKIVGIKASMNRGLSPELKAAFPQVIPVKRPLVLYKYIQDPNWLAGFTSAEGCFIIKIFKAKTKLGEAVRLEFTLTQHARDEQLMRSFIKYLDSGYIISWREAFNFRVTKFSDINQKIIPFFQKHPILGVKAEDFKNWCKVAKLIRDKKHLTLAGLKQIKKIKAGMNRGIK